MAVLPDGKIDIREPNQITHNQINTWNFCSTEPDDVQNKDGDQQVGNRPNDQAKHRRRGAGLQRPNLQGAIRLDTGRLQCHGKDAHQLAVPRNQA